MQTAVSKIPRSVGWKVGELARQTGLTQRTLRYYDEIGLLKPSHYTEAGYRLYTANDIARLQQIKSLRGLGLSLEEVRDWLDSPNFAPLQAVQLQLNRVREQMELMRVLCERLEAVADWLRSADDPPAGLLIQTIEVMMNVDFSKYYTPEQLEELRKRYESDREHIKEVEAEWPQLIAKVRAEMEAGTDPADERVQALARRWQELINEFTQGNPEIEKALSNLYAQEPSMHQMAGIDEKLSAYIEKVMRAAK